MKDKLGNSFHIGCKVVRAITDGHLAICEVTQIIGESLYLDHSKQPIKFPSRLLIIEQDPLYKLVKNYKPND